MKQRKLNHSPWLSLGLAAVMLAGCLVMATGTSFARYRVENKADVYLEARPLEQIRLGQMVRDENDPEKRIFDPESQGTWHLVDGVTRLDFAVSNGALEEKTITAADGTKTVKEVEVYAQEDQRVLVQLVGGLSFWDGQEEMTLTLRAPSKTKLDELEEYTATPQRIQPESQLYKTFGDGWVFTFRDKNKEPLSWTLEGGEWSVLELTLIYEGPIPENAGLLKLQITGDYTKK